MRSRPDLTVYLKPAQPTPGTRVEAEAVLKSQSETPIDGVEATLTGVERRFSGNAVLGVHRHADLLARSPKSVLTPGEHRFRFSFDIPPTAPPAYRSQTASVGYDLHVRVDIPWWPDRSARYLVPVVASPSTPPQPEPAIVCTDTRGPQGTALYVEASIEGAAVPLGGAIRGAVSLANVAHHRIRRVDLALVQMESPRGNPQRSVEAQRYLVELCDGAPTDGQALPFNVRVPDTAPVSLHGALIEVHWFVEIRAVVTLGSDVTLHVPFTVYRSRGGAEGPSQPLARVPPVGRRRRALVWAESAARHGLANDAENERMTLDLQAPGAGPVQLAITLEPRKGGGLALTAAVTWPSLGIELAVTERRWLDAWSGGTAIDVPGFAERFTARAREAAQVRAFLDATLCRWLLRFEEAALGDEGATLVALSAANSREELDEFVARAVSAVRALADALGRVPPPAAMEGFVPAWRAYAGSLGGRLSVGDVSIHDAGFDDASLSIVTHYREGAPCSTTIRFPLPERERDAGSPAEPRELDGPTRALVASLEAQVKALAIEERAVEAQLPAPIADPASLEPILVGLGRLARRLAGGTARGPYR